MQPTAADTLILSDLHLGAEVSRAREALLLLRCLEFKRLILLGDIFCDLNFRRLQKHHWRFLSEIRKLSNPKRGIEIVWVEGNHDLGLTEVMSHLVGIRVYQMYEWQFAGKRFLAVHGHQFDRFVVNNRVLSNVLERLHLALQRLEPNKKWLSRFLDQQNSRWLRLAPKVRTGALALARERGADVVICGHTHEAEQAEEDGIQYFNSGCWTGSDAKAPTFITVTEQGISLHEFTAGLQFSQEVVDEDPLYADSGAA